MSIRDEIKGYIVKSGLSINELLEKYNNKYEDKITYSNFHNKLTKETIRYKEVKQIAEIINYKIQWTPKYYSSVIEEIENNTSYFPNEAKENETYYLNKSTEQIFNNAVKSFSKSNGLSPDIIYLEIIRYLNSDEFRLYLLKHYMEEPYKSNNTLGIVDNKKSPESE